MINGNILNVYFFIVSLFFGGLEQEKYLALMCEILMKKTP